MKSEDNLTIYIIEKTLASAKHLSKTEIEVPAGLNDFKQLMTILVQREIEYNYNQRNFEVKDEGQLQTLIKFGKVGGSIDPREYHKPNLEKEVEKALISFKHGDFMLFIDEREIESIDDDLGLKNGSELMIMANVRFTSHRYY